jgi:antitoxin component YwqK of YwqJK toxin-antitoxin module
MKKIECKYCGWSWNESDGGDDKYMCHMCDNDNSKHYLKESEESKKGKLFIPRKLSGEESRWADWNKMQPIVDGVRINQYDINTGKKEGIWEHYYSNGQLMSKGLYKNGERDGIWEEYWNNGNLNSKGSYKNGERDGIWKEYYYGNGQLSFKELYKDGKYVKKLPLTESEESKKGKLFIPRRLSGENSRFIQWNKEQPIVDGVQINQYTHDGKKEGYWDNWVDDNDILVGKGLFVKGKKEGYWEEYLDGELVGKGSYKNGKESGIWEFYEDGEVYRKELFQSGKLVGRWYPSKDTLDESEQSKKGKLFIPRRIEGRWDDYLKSTITTDYNMGSYLERRDFYRDNSKNIDPLVMKLSKGDLITFVKANPFWLNSLDKVIFLLNTLNYKENKDIAENHIGQTFAKGNFWTSPEMNYYENKFKIPKSNYGKIDIYVFVGSDEFKETRNGLYKKVFDIERLMKVSVDDWKDTKDYGRNKDEIWWMRLRASSNNKQLYKISAHKGLLDEYDGETGSEIPEFILSAIDEKKERV